MEEFKLIRQIRSRYGKPGKGLVLGIGDDCAVLEKDSGSYLLWASDMIVEGRHFTVRDGYERIGRKAAAVNISDIAAMGGVPGYISVSIGVPTSVTAREVLRIYKGINGICSEYGVRLSGGDTVGAESIVIDVSILGTVRKNALVKRSGARAGDVVAVTGPVRDGKKEHLDFRPRLAESGLLVKKHKPNAMIDVSDGIAPDISKICEESGVGCVLYRDKIPLVPDLGLEDALYYGESFELLFTMARSGFEKISRHPKRGNLAGFYEIGEIVPRGRGLKIRGGSHGVEKLDPRAYDHLRPSGRMKAGA